jgi:amidase
MVKLSEYSSYDGLGLAELVKKKEVTSQELVTAALEGIEKVNPTLNCINNVLADSAAKEAAAGVDGPFKGVPFLIKEIVLHAADVPCNMGSQLADGFTLPHDTELMTRFRKAGLITVATTPTPEFGYNATTEATFYGPTKNPWNTNHSPGGSSGGSGASVAAGIVPVAHANDGGGSIRIPASCNGLVGLKPSRGRVPTGPDYGELLNGIAVEFALTRTVRDCAALLDAVAGPDVGCYGWAESPKKSYVLEAATQPGKLRIAWMGKPLSGVPVDSECLQALQETVQLCQDLGHELVEDAPMFDIDMFSLATLRIWGANLASMMDGVAAFTQRTPSPENLEAGSWACYQFGQSLTATELLQAIDINTMVSRQVGAFFTKYDVLLSPTTAHPPLPLGQLNQNAAGLSAKEWTEQIFTYAPFTNLFNATGQPAISLPLGWSKNNLPIGMQFAGRFADEATLLRLAAQLEQSHPWNNKRPAVHV